MRATHDTLTLRAEAPDGASLRRLQDVIGGRIAQIGGRASLTVEWDQRAAARPGAQLPNQTADAPRRAKVFGVSAIVAVVLFIVVLLTGHPG